MIIINDLLFNQAVITEASLHEFALIVKRKNLLVNLGLEIWVMDK